MHLAESMRLPKPFTARPYRGAIDHPAMCAVLASHRAHGDGTETPTVEQLDAMYANLPSCDPDRDLVVVESGSEPIAYIRVEQATREDGSLDLRWFAPTIGAHTSDTDLYAAILDPVEEHQRDRAGDAPRARFTTYVMHPGPGREPTGRALVHHQRGYEVLTWAAHLIRPDFDDIPDRQLPDGVEVRPVTPEQVRPIWEAFFEAFRGEWDFREPTSEQVDAEIADPFHDPSLWKIAWAGDEIVGQVKSYINTESNRVNGTRRGYAEYISTHHDWRNRGIAGALLARSLLELRERGMTEAVLSVDTNNPGGALHLYKSMGFEPVGYGAVFVKPVD